MIKDSIRKFYKSDIDVYTVTKSVNSYGEMIATWSKNRTIFGRIRPMSGAEPFVAGAEHQISKYRLYTDDFNIRENNQIRWSGKTFDVKFVSNPMTFDQFCQIDLELVT